MAEGSSSAAPAMSPSPIERTFDDAIGLIPCTTHARRRYPTTKAAEAHVERAPADAAGPFVMYAQGRWSWSPI
jgi:hypothetical protein